MTLLLTLQRPKVLRVMFVGVSWCEPAASGHTALVRMVLHVHGKPAKCGRRRAPPGRAPAAFRPRAGRVLCSTMTP